MVLQNTTPSSFACHPSTGGELPGADACNRPSVSVLVISPPQEGNCRVCPSVSVLNISPPQEENCLAVPVCEFDGYEDTTPSSFACHPSTGGELPGADAIQSPQCICASHSPPQEGNCRVQRRCNRPSVSVLNISPPQEGN